MPLFQCITQQLNRYLESELNTNKTKFDLNEIYKYCTIDKLDYNYFICTNVNTYAEAIIYKSKKYKIVKKKISGKI